MKLSQIKRYLSGMESDVFKLEDGISVPEHFHVIEAGMVTNKSIDCGGNVRHEDTVTFQLWDADDYEHRVKPQKLLNIIELSEKVLGIEDGEIEVEYQQQTIGKYGLDFIGKIFILTSKQTACLAMDACGIPQQKQKLNLQDLSKDTTSCCTPGGNCC